MQDLVRVGVADSAQQLRVGQGPLEGVVLTRERLAKLRQGGAIELKAAGVVLGECILTAQEVEHGALLAARLGEEKAAGWEVEYRVAASARGLGAGCPPA